MNIYTNYKLLRIILLLIIIPTAISGFAQPKRQGIQILRQLGRMSADATTAPATLSTDLGTMLERKIVASRAQQISRITPIFQQIQTLTLPQIWQYSWDNKKYSGLEQKEGPDMDQLFLRLANKKFPTYIPIKGISLDPMYEDQTMQTLWENLAEEYSLGAKKVVLGVAACKKIDQLLFAEIDGQVFINVPVLEHFHSYGRALEGVMRTVNSFALYPLSTNSIKQFVILRNQQITSSIESYLNSSTQDITTQRTAEEIKQLVENLDPENPLRISVESALRTTATNGHIHPLEDPKH